MADVKWTFFADTAAAERQIQALEQKYSKLENAVSQVSRRTKATANESGSALDAIGLKALKTAAAYVSVGSAVAFIVRENDRLLKQADELAEKSETQVRRLRVQAGLTQLQGDIAKAGIRAASAVVGLTEEQGFQAATQMVSSGFSAEQATGPALSEFLKVLAASNQTGKDVDATSLAKAMVSYLNSQGQALNAESVAKAGVGFQRLFKATDIQLPDLEALSKIGSVLSGKLTQEEQFATLATLKTEGGLPASEAATAMRNITSFLATAAGDKTKSGALKQLGLQPSQVDLVGESFTDAMKLIGERTAQQAPEKVAPILKNLFGVETVAAAGALFANQGKTAERRGILGDRAGFNEDLAIATGGMNAAKARLQLENEAALADRGQRYDVYREALMKAYSSSSGPMRWMAGAQFDVAAAFGTSPEGAASYAAGDKQTQLDVARIAEEAMRPAQEQTRLLQDVAKSNREMVELARQQAADAKANQPKINRNAQGE